MLKLLIRNSLLRILSQNTMRCILMERSQVRCSWATTIGRMTKAGEKLWILREASSVIHNYNTNRCLMIKSECHSYCKVKEQWLLLKSTSTRKNSETTKMWMERVAPTVCSKGPLISLHLLKVLTRKILWRKLMTYLRCQKMAIQDFVRVLKSLSLRMLAQNTKKISLRSRSRKLIW